ncbi:MAG: hypothetical protein WCP28_09955 [Actinomycetes bacterium]
MLQTETTYARRWKPLVGLAVAAALVVLAAGIGYGYGYWRVSRACPQWASEQGATVTQNDWWAKTNSCTVILGNGTVQSYDIGIGERLVTTATVLGIWLGGAALVAMMLAVLVRRRGRDCLERGADSGV